MSFPFRWEEKIEKKANDCYIYEEEKKNQKNIAAENKTEIINLALMKMIQKIFLWIITFHKKEWDRKYRNNKKCPNKNGKYK